MPIPSTIADLSAVAASNYPQGSESPSTGDDYIRAVSAIVRQVYDGAALSADLSSSAVGKGSQLSTFIQRLTGAVARTSESKMADALDARDFGVVADGVTDDTTKLQAANTAATAAGKYLKLPAGTIVYNPAAAINISTAWVGDSKFATIINVSNSYAGEVFRLLTQSKMTNLAIQKPGLTKTAGSIGVRVSAPLVKDICVGVYMENVYIRGFDKNLDHQNSYVFTAVNCQLESGNEGVYCVPDATTYGFITTHLYLHLSSTGNARNIYYSSSGVSQNITLIEPVIENATGVNQQAYFNNVRNLNITNAYCEGASTIKALQFADVRQATVAGLYLNGTGGVFLAANAEIGFKDVRITTSTDVLTGADGSQILRMEGCLWPNSGNSAITAWKNVTLQQTTYNAVAYGFYTRNASLGFKDISQSGGGTVAIDLNNGNWQRITVTDAVAFTIGAPSNMTSGAPLKITIQNSAGAPMGAITWNAVFKKTAFTNPATGNNRTIVFNYDGSSWFEEKNTADVPN